MKQRIKNSFLYLLMSCTNVTAQNLGDFWEFFWKKWFEKEWFKIFL